jgi:hypothetical protein
MPVHYGEAPKQQPYTQNIPDPVELDHTRPVQELMNTERR